MIDSLTGIHAGTEIQLFMLIQGMVSRGHEVTLYVLRETEFTRNLGGFPCRICCVGVERVFSVRGLWNLWRFRKELVDQKVDVVHGFFNDVALVLPPLLLGAGIRHFTSRRDMGIWYSRTKIFFLRVFRFAKTRLICNSLAVAEFTQKWEWKSKQAITVIYNGISPFPATGTEEVAEVLAEREDAQANVNVILTANVRPVKRIGDLIMAASKLQTGHPKVKFYVIGDFGDGREFLTLQRLLSAHQLEHKVFFTGELENPRSVRNQFDIGVLTSESEGFSNSIMEYMNAGLPVVATNVGGNPELVSDGCNGFLYEAGDIEALADRIGRLVDDAKLRRAMGQRGRESIRNFHGRIMVGRHEKVYSKPYWDR